MRRIKKDVVKEQETVVEITKREFIELTAKECTKVLLELADDDDDEMALIIPLICAKFGAHITVAMFGADEEEK